jgi:hypothetical protein
MFALNVITIWLIPISLLIAGLLGNLIGFFAFLRLKLSKHPTSFMYKSMALIDFAYLCSQMIGIINQNLNQLIFLEKSCQVYIYMNNSIRTISSYILVYISLERLIWMCFPKLKLLKVFNFQQMILVFVFVISFSIFLTIFFLNDSNQKGLLSEYSCQLFESQEHIILEINLIYSHVVPFALMMFISMTLLCLIIKSKLKMISLNTRKDRKKFKKELRFSVTSVIFNFNFIVFNSIPFSCLTHFIFFKNYFRIFLYFYLFGFCSKFYILAYFNPIFRKELYFMVEFKSKLKRHYNTFIH